MNINAIIAALREYAASFSGRVSGAAEFEAAFAASGSATSPCAWVIPLEDSGESESQTGTRVTLTEMFGVFVMIDASADPRGQAARLDVDTLRLEVFGALAGWQMSDNCGPLEYEGGELVRLDRARLFYRYDFSVASTLESTASRQFADLEALPGLSEVRIRTDIIDPAADPNTPPVTDPAEGGYPGGSPGPDGRIEHEMRVILPTNEE